MANYATQCQQAAAVDVSRVRSAFACVMPASGVWSAMGSAPTYLGVTTIDHKPEPRRLRVTSP
jgi:hypothetical protein